MEERYVSEERSRGRAVKYVEPNTRKSEVAELGEDQRENHHHLLPLVLVSLPRRLLLPNDSLESFLRISPCLYPWSIEVKRHS